MRLPLQLPMPPRIQWAGNNQSSLENLKSPVWTSRRQCLAAHSRCTSFASLNYGAANHLQWRDTNLWRTRIQTACQRSALRRLWRNVQTVDSDGWRTQEL